MRPPRGGVLSMTNSAPSARNRRLSQRRPAKGRLRVICRRGGLDLGPNLALAVLDLSETGVRLVVKEALEPGREVSVSLEGQSNLRPILRVGNVAWCVPSADGSHCVGVCYQKRLAYRDFLELSREPSACG